MDSAENVETSQEIEAKIVETRAALNHKLETLKNEVQTTVTEASHTVQDTVDTIKSRLSIKHQVHSHPWIAVSIAATVGVGLGRSLKKRTFKENSSELVAGRGNTSEKFSEGTRPILKNVMEQFKPELRSVKSLVVGSGISLVGGVIKKALPDSIQTEVSRIIGHIRKRIEKAI